ILPRHSGVIDIVSDRHALSIPILLEKPAGGPAGGPVARSPAPAGLAVCPGESGKLPALAGLPVLTEPEIISEIRLLRLGLQMVFEEIRKLRAEESPLRHRHPKRP